MNTHSKNRGFTVIEMVVVFALIAVAAIGTYFLLNPAQQLARSRNQRRSADINIVANAIQRKKIDNRGVFSCSSGGIPTIATRMASSTGNYNVAPCLVPLYLDNFPHDPNAANARYNSITDYDSAYLIAQNTASSTVTITAPYAELEEIISITR